MNKITTIIFDLGRVLVNVQGGEKFARLMQAMGIEPENAFNTFWYEAELRQFMTGELDAPSFYQMAKDRFSLPHSFEEFADGWCDLFSPYPGMEEIFNQMAEKYTVGILSDTDPLHWQRISAQYPWLERANTTFSFEVGYLKPHPAMFDAAAKKCGKQVAECLFIDDKQDNVDGARYRGMPALPFQGPEKLIKALNGLGLL